MGNQISEVRLLNVPLESDYKHTLYFANKASQESYFLGKSTSFNTFTELSYQRKEKYISIPRNYESLKTFNYLMYRNQQGHYDDWYYAFITRMEYKSDSVTWVYFEIDVMQTYLSKYTIKPSFIEREHTDNDTIGAHTFPENLEVGEFVSHYTQEDSTLTALSVVLATTEPDPSLEEVLGDSGTVLQRYRGTVSGLIYHSYTIDKLSDLRSLVNEYDEAGKADAIQAMFICPTFVASLLDGTNIPDHTKPASFEINVGGGIVTAMADAYYPRNKKLLTFPYKYLLVSNNAGASAVYHYEYFKNASSGMKFKVYGTITPGGSIRMLPMNYKGVDENNEEGLNLGKYPICNWTSDAFTNWMTQNSVNIGLTIASGVGQIVGGGITSAIGGVTTGGLGVLSGGGQIVGGVSTIAGQLAQIHQMSFTPNQSRGNINNGDVTTTMNKNTFTFYGMSIRPEYARIIDGFFDMFGYKVNQVKTPLVNHRDEYWYTKTIDVSIDGDIPSEDMQKIKDCYNRGITFWKNPANIGDYSVRNEIA